MASQETVRNIVREIVRQALTEMNIESSTESPRTPSTYYAPWTGVEFEAHPSREQFDIKEATVSAGELLEFVDSKLCSIEKNKACDLCGLCKSLGF